MLYNTIGTEWIMDPENGWCEVHIPFPCDFCGERSCYGGDGKWYCTMCWQTMRKQSARNQTRLDEPVL